MKKILILISATFLSGIAICQQVADLPANSFPFNLTGTTIQTFDDRHEGVVGYYTFFEDFSAGIVELKNKGVYKNVLINYDAVSDNLIAKSERISSAMVVRKDLVQQFVLSDGVREFKFIKLSVNGLPTYLLVLVEGDLTFYCKTTKSIKRADLGGAYNTSESRNDEFRSVNTYYIADRVGLRELPQTKKGIIRSFPHMEDKLNVFFKKNKINFSDHAEAQFLFEFIQENR
ncbi:MAG: hypothetical protein KF845_02445 [Cyclobacteriaceae bacterium]|nr:hypothetical protein [Cyclobacteriaceae bacterium]